MSRSPASLRAPRPLEFTVPNFKGDQSITYRLVGGLYYYRLAGEHAFTPSGRTTYAGAAAHARRRHGIVDPFARAGATHAIA